MSSSNSRVSTRLWAGDTLGQQNLVSDAICEFNLALDIYAFGRLYHTKEALFEVYLLLVCLCIPYPWHSVIVE